MSQTDGSVPKGREEPRRGPTIIDVAHRAGVSKSLVSLVMRGAPNVSEERRRAVLEAAAELRYRPNAMAQILVRRRSFVIGVMLSDLHNPFFTAVVDGISSHAHTADYRALINTGDRSPGSERDAVETLLRLRTDGIVLAGTVIDAATIDRVGREVPLVLASRVTRSRVVDSVVTDDVAGAGLAVEHLIRLGHRRIAHITGGRGAGSRHRATGYRRAMGRHGLAGEISVVPGSYTEMGGIDGVRRLQAEGTLPTAIFAPNDLAAIGVLQALEARGLQRARRRLGGRLRRQPPGGPRAHRAHKRPAGPDGDRVNGCGVAAGTARPGANRAPSRRARTRLHHPSHHRSSTDACLRGWGGALRRAT